MTPSHAAALERARECHGLGDMRTKAARRREVIRQVRERGGFSVFWVTEFHLRAVAADELTAEGVMVRGDSDAPFPWCTHKIVERSDHGRKRTEGGGQPCDPVKGEESDK